jgi:hypothetical protein
MQHGEDEMLITKERRETTLNPNAKKVKKIPQTQQLLL